MTQIAYQTFRLNLNAAGTAEFLQRVGLIHVVEFQDANGEPDLDGMVECAVGEGSDKFIPLRYNSKIALPETVEKVSFRWAAQTGLYAIVLFSPKPAMMMADTPPTRQLVTSSIGTAITVAEVTCNNTADLLAAADSSRQSVLIKNLSGETAYLGPSSVATTDGYPLEVGAEIRIDKSTAAIYGVTATAGGATLRTFTEAG